MEAPNGGRRGGRANRPRYRRGRGRAAAAACGGARRVPVRGRGWARRRALVRDRGARPADGPDRARQDRAVRHGGLAAARRRPATARSACCSGRTTGATRPLSSWARSRPAGRPTTATRMTRWCWSWMVRASCTPDRPTIRWLRAAACTCRPGSCVHLPPGQVHCLENTGTTTLWVLGVFHPGGSPAAKQEHSQSGASARPGR